MTRQRAEYPLNYNLNGEGSSNRPHGLADITADRMQEMTDKVEAAAQQVVEQAQVYGEKAQQALNNAKPYIENSLRTQPYTTLAVASALGFLLGALWKK